MLFEMEKKKNRSKDKDWEKMKQYFDSQHFYFVVQVVFLFT